MPMKNPPHPGRSIRNACLEPLGCPLRGARKFSASPGRRSTTSSMASRASAPRWRSGSRSRLAARRKRGYGCNSPTTSHKPASTRAKFRSAVSTCPRNCTPVDPHRERRVSTPYYLRKEDIEAFLAAFEEYKRGKASKRVVLRITCDKGRGC